MENGAGGHVKDIEDSPDPPKTIMGVGGDMLAARVAPPLGHRRRGGQPGGSRPRHPLIRAAITATIAVVGAAFSVAARIHHHRRLGRRAAGRVGGGLEGYRNFGDSPKSDT